MVDEHCNTHVVRHSWRSEESALRASSAHCFCSKGCAVERSQIGVFAPALCLSFNVLFGTQVTFETLPTRISPHSFRLPFFPLVIHCPGVAKLHFLAGVYIGMTKITPFLSILAVSGVLIASAAAQPQSNTSGAGAGQVDPGHPRVNQVNGRETNQQNRIANGIKNGQLKPGQTARLEHGEQRLQNNEKRDMAADNGHLTKKDQHQLNHEANNMSKRIYDDKHSK
jgi:hypothetical protein